jgi:hypothetical protein
VFNVHGSWSFTSALGTVPSAGARQRESVTFTPTDGTDYLTVTITVIINVAQTAPVVSVNPINLSYGTPLANSQLSGPATWTKGGSVVTVPGSWSFTSALGTLLKLGAGQRESVTFTPFDGTDYVAITIMVTINVLRATPTITWANPADIAYGTPLGPAQLDATASVPGTLVYYPDSGTVLSAGQGQSLAATFTPADTADYNVVTTTAKINVYPPVVKVLGLQITQVPVTTGTGKRARTKVESGLLLQFTGALPDTGIPAAYQLFTGKTRRGVTNFNTKVALKVINFTSTTVTLLHTGKLNQSLPEQLQITESDLIDAFGRPLNGGQPFSDTFGNKTVKGSE